MCIVGGGATDMYIHTSEKKPPLWKSLLRMQPKATKWIRSSSKNLQSGGVYLGIIHKRGGFRGWGTRGDWRKVSIEVRRQGEYGAGKAENWGSSHLRPSSSSIWAISLIYILARPLLALEFATFTGANSSTWSLKNQQALTKGTKKRKAPPVQGNCICKVHVCERVLFGVCVCVCMGRREKWARRAWRKQMRRGWVLPWSWAGENQTCF